MLGPELTEAVRRIEQARQDAAAALDQIRARVAQQLTTIGSLLPDSTFAVDHGRAFQARLAAMDHERAFQARLAAVRSEVVATCDLAILRIEAAITPIPPAASREVSRELDPGSRARLEAFAESIGMTWVEWLTDAGQGIDPALIPARYAIGEIMNTHRTAVQVVFVETVKAQVEPLVRGARELLGNSSRAAALNARLANDLHEVSRATQERWHAAVANLSQEFVDAIRLDYGDDAVAPLAAVVDKPLSPSIGLEQMRRLATSPPGHIPNARPGYAPAALPPVFDVPPGDLNAALPAINQAAIDAQVVFAEALVTAGDAICDVVSTTFQDAGADSSRLQRVRGEMDAIAQWSYLRIGEAVSSWNGQTQALMLESLSEQP